MRIRTNRDITRMMVFYNTDSTEVVIPEYSEGYVKPKSSFRNWSVVIFDNNKCLLVKDEWFDKLHE